MHLNNSHSKHNTEITIPKGPVMYRQENFHYTQLVLLITTSQDFSLPHSNIYTSIQISLFIATPPLVSVICLHNIAFTNSVQQ